MAGMTPRGYYGYPTSPTSRYPVVGATPRSAPTSTGAGMSGGIATGPAVLTPQGQATQNQQVRDSRNQQLSALEQQRQQQLATQAAQLALQQRQHAFQQEQAAAGHQSALLGNMDNYRETESNPNGVSLRVGAGGGGTSGTGTRGPGGSGGGTPPGIPPELLDALKPIPPPPFPTPPPLPPRTPYAQPTLEDPAQAFAGTKDISGRQGVAAVRALRDLMTRRGLSDSGMEAEQEAAILATVANANTEADRDARTRNVERLNQFALANAGLGSGERGQDTSYGANTFGSQAGYGASIYGSQTSQRNNALDALMRWYSRVY